MCVLIWEREKKRSGQSEEFLHMPSPPLRPEQREEGERNDMGMNEKISWHFLWRLMIKGFDETGNVHMTAELNKPQKVNVAKVRERKHQTDTHTIPDMS